MSQAAAAWTPIEPQVGLLPIANIDPGLYFSNVSLPNPPSAVGYASGTTLTITTMGTGTVAVGQQVISTNPSYTYIPGTVITSFGTGTGGAGTYNINNSQTVASSGSPGGFILVPNVPTLPNIPGRVVRAANAATGAVGEFILLAGVASTVVGSLVTYDTGTFLTTLAPVGSNLPRPVAVAMAANTLPNNWAWYQIGGIATAAKSTATNLAVGVAVGVKTVGILNTSGTGKEVQGALVALAAATAATTVQLLLDRPHMQGRIT